MARFGSWVDWRWWAVVCLVIAGAVGVHAQDKAVGPVRMEQLASARVSAEDLEKSGVEFRAADSRGVFIGINDYTAPRGVRPANLKSCVNDAVDLASTMVALGLIEPAGVTLVLSGEPSKPESASALEHLLASGATRTPDGNRDTIDGAASEAAASSGQAGILFITWSSHGFEANGVQYLAPANFYSAAEGPSTAEIVSRALPESALSAVAQTAPAGRRILIFDACRETRSLEQGLPTLIGQATGTLVLYATTSGSLAVDGSRNGAFTARILDALTSEEPPASLKPDENGCISLGGLLEHLNTAGHVEDPGILRMPLRRHPVGYAAAREREALVECFREAKAVDLAAPDGERHLDAIPVEAVRMVLLSGGRERADYLAGELRTCLGTAESRANPVMRRSFKAAWEALPPAALVAAATPVAAAPTAAPTLSPAAGEKFLGKWTMHEDSARKFVAAAWASLKVPKALIDQRVMIFRSNPALEIERGEGGLFAIKGLTDPTNAPQKLLAIDWEGELSADGSEIVVSLGSDEPATFRINEAGWLVTQAQQADGTRFPLYLGNRSSKPFTPGEDAGRESAGKAPTPAAQDSDVIIETMKTSEGLRFTLRNIGDGGISIRETRFEFPVKFDLTTVEPLTDARVKRSYKSIVRLALSPEEEFFPKGETLYIDNRAGSPAIIQNTCDSMSGDVPCRIESGGEMIFDLDLVGSSSDDVSWGTASTHNLESLPADSRRCRVTVKYGAKGVYTSDWVAF